VVIKIAPYCAVTVPTSVPCVPDLKQETQNIPKIFIYYALKFAKRVLLNAASMLHIKRVVLRAQKPVSNAPRLVQWLKISKIFTI
jgi:hypothetical protein